MTRKEVMKLEDMVVVDQVVRIQGTNWDRRRKLTNKMISNIQKSYNSGRTIPELADKYGVSTTTIRYWVDPEYRSWKNAERNKYAHNTKQDMIDRVERGSYKMLLVMTKKRVGYVK